MESISITLNGREAVTLFLQPMVMIESVLQTFRIMPRLTTKKRLHFFGNLEGIIQKNTGCGWNAQGGVDITSREIEPTRLKINLELCSDEFWDTIFEDALGVGLDIEKNPQVLVALLIRRINEAVAKDLYVLGWFGDKSSANTFLNQLDGMFALIGDAIASNLITEVDAGSGADLADGAAYGIFDELLNTAPLELRQLPDNLKVIKVTDTVYQNYVKYLESLGTESANRVLVDGIPRLTFRGILIENHPIWDSKFANAKTHCAVYSINQNFVCGLDTTSPETELAIWEQMKEEMLYIKGKFKAGFNYVHEKYIAIAI